MKKLIDIVNELIEIENSANEILINAEKDKLILPEVIDLISKQVNQKIDELVELEINSVKEKSLSLKNERIIQIISRTDEFISKMESEFTQNKDEWVQNIFDNVLEDF